MPLSSLNTSARHMRSEQSSLRDRRLNTMLAYADAANEETARSSSTRLSLAPPGYEVGACHAPTSRYRELDRVNSPHRSTQRRLHGQNLPARFARLQARRRHVPMPYRRQLKRDARKIWIEQGMKRNILIAGTFVAFGTAGGIYAGTSLGEDAAERANLEAQVAESKGMNEQADADVLELDVDQLQSKFDVSEGEDPQFLLQLHDYDGSLAAFVVYDVNCDNSLSTNDYVIEDGEAFEVVSVDETNVATWKLTHENDWQLQGEYTGDETAADVLQLLFDQHPNIFL